MESAKNIAQILPDSIATIKNGMWKWGNVAIGNMAINAYLIYSFTIADIYCILYF